MLLLITNYFCMIDGRCNQQDSLMCHIQFSNRNISRFIFSLPVSGNKHIPGSEYCLYLNSFLLECDNPNFIHKYAIYLSALVRPLFTRISRTFIFCSDSTISFLKPKARPMWCEYANILPMCLDNNIVMTTAIGSHFCNHHPPILDVRVTENKIRSCMWIYIYN